MLPALHSLRPADGNQTGEIVTPLLEGRRFRMEHLASYGARSDPGFWYDQDLPEWVALLQGTATLEFEDGTLHVAAGDCLLIPRHLRHRVSATSRDAIWLALHFEPDPEDEGAIGQPG